MKCRYTAGRVFGKMSPSMRREWIEIPHQCLQTPPMMSPSMRREWIEMAHKLKRMFHVKVSLHAEGVD